MRRLLALLTLAIVALPVLADGLPPPVLAALKAAQIPAGSVAVVVQPVDARAPLVAHNSQKAMNPASVMKLVTTYAALDLLGPAWTWKTTALADTAAVDGVLRGNLYLKGSGDPRFAIEHLSALLRQLRVRGIQHIGGDIVLDRAVFDVPERDPGAFDDEPLRPYNAAPDGLLVNFKALVFTFTPEPAKGRVLVRSEPPIAGVDIPTEVPLTAGACGDWRTQLRADFSSPQRVQFGGRYAASCGERIWPVAYVEPRTYAARVVQAMWQGAGGRLGGRVREGATPANARLWLAAESLPVGTVIADINKFSNNVMAQQLFLTFSSQPQGPGTFEGSRQRLVRWWRERFAGQPAPVLDNGSGLSREERSSAAALTALLRRAAASPQAEAFIQSLGLAGVDGTVARMRERNGASPALGNAWLKTGSLRDVAAVAGYVNGRSGQRYSLVALINHDNAGAARAALDLLVDWVAQEP